MAKLDMPHRYRVVALLFLLVVVMYLDRLCIAVAGPRIQKELGIGPVGWGWVIGVFTLAYAVMGVPSGVLGDRIGPHKVLTGIVLWWSAFTALTGVVGGYASLLVVRFLFGAGEGGTFPNCTAAIARWIPPRERGRANSLFWVATSAGSAITPLIVVPLQQALGWRACFYLFGCPGLIWAAVWYSRFRDNPKDKKGVSPEELKTIGAAVATARPAVNWGQVLRDSNFQRLLVMYHTYCWGVYFYLSWLPTYLQAGRGLTENGMRIASSLPPCAGIFGILAGGFLTDRLLGKHSIRFARCLIGSVGLIGAGILMLAASRVSGNTTAVALLALGLGSMNLMLPVAWAVCLDIGGRSAGAVSAAMNMAGQGGSFLSSVVFGYLVHWLHSYDAALAPLASMLLVSGVMFALIDPGRKLPGVAHHPAKTEE